MLPFSVKDLLKNDKHLQRNIMFVSQSGSYLYNLNDEQSDFDYFVLAENTMGDYILDSWDQYRVNLPDADVKVMSAKQFVNDIHNARFEALMLLCANREKYSYCSLNWEYIYNEAANIINKDILFKKAKGFMLDVLICNRKDFLVNKNGGSELSAGALNERIKTATKLGVYHVMSDTDFNVSVNIRNADLEECYIELRKVANILRDFSNGRSSVKERSKHKDMAYNVLMGLLACHVLSTGNFEFKLKDSDLAILKGIKAGKYLTKQGVTNEYLEMIYSIIGDMTAAYDDSKLPSVEESEASYKKVLHNLMFDAVMKEDRMG